MSKLMTLQELVDIENKYGIDDFILYFNNFLDEINRRVKNNDKSIENIFLKKNQTGVILRKREFLGLFLQQIILFQNLINLLKDINGWLMKNLFLKNLIFFLMLKEC